MLNNFGDEVPDKLYKYRFWPNEYTKDILVNDRLYMNMPIEFNDPFDCDLNISIESEDLWFFFRDVLSRTCKSMASEVELKWLSLVLEISAKVIERIDLENIKNKIPDKYLQNIYNMAFELVQEFSVKMKKQVRIYCFSSKCTDLLMWSHYGGYHKGICLGFYLYKLKMKPIKVYYDDGFSTIHIENIIQKFKNKEKLFLSQKAKAWEYEYEYRIFRNAMEGTYYPIKSETLADVICGCAMLEEDFKLLLDVLTNRQTPVNVYKAKKKKYSFGLDLEYVGQYGGIKLLPMPINK